MPFSANASHALYSRPDRWLHRIALEYRAVMETSFDIERSVFGRAARRIEISQPIFVCGLARAGTSLVTRLLDGTGAFAAPGYRDMPFPLAPNLWARMSGGDRRKVESAERAHGDGLVHDLDSPEAIEEVFWRCFESERYLTPQGLVPAMPRKDTMAALGDYMRLVMLRRDKLRYLSKNNNNVLRLAALAEALPDAIFVHPFRDPVSQAESLRSQHLRACALQADDPFRRDYMRWLAHHEFGCNQRPFLLPDGPDPRLDRKDAAYWLGAWGSVYGYLLDQPASVRARQVFVDFDALCEAPGSILAALSSRLDVAVPGFEQVRVKAAPAAGMLPAAIARVHETLKRAAFSNNFVA